MSNVGVDEIVRTLGPHQQRLVNNIFPNSHGINWRALRSLNPNAPEERFAYMAAIDYLLEQGILSPDQGNIKQTKEVQPHFTVTILSGSFHLGPVHYQGKLPLYFTSPDDAENYSRQCFVEPMRPVEVRKA